MDDVTHKPVRNLECACCGSGTRGRQWHNRDTGYGFCVSCFDWLSKRGTSAEEIEKNYGVRGVHWDVKDDSRCCQGL